MSLLQSLKTKRLYLDGAMGTMLQARGLKTGEYPERMNLTHGDVITRIHKEYFDAGSNIVCTNTFGANVLKFSEEELDSVIGAAVGNARSAAQLSESKGEKYVALDVGPLGKLLKPFGDLDFNRAVEIFGVTVRLGAKYGVDAVYIETVSDTYELKAAILAAKENCSLPVLASVSYGSDGKLLTGGTPSEVIALAEGMGADAIGANCSVGPDKMASIAKQYLQEASIPVLLKPNAGLPQEIDGKCVYAATPESFAEQMQSIAAMGVNLLGGCCGTTPEYIRQTVKATTDIPYTPIVPKNTTVVSSYCASIAFGNKPLIIGERINPTGKKRFKQALIEKDMDYLLKEGLAQQENGAHILDVNVGIPDIDETYMLTEAVSSLQAVTSLPLQIDTSDAEALENALRIYNGKAMVNSVNGKAESMAAVFPLVKKYGGVVVALTLDESGIPSTAEGRIAIARKILNAAADYGIDKKNIVFDALCLTAATDTNAPRVTLDAVRHLSREMGMNTVLGVSNVSFGLPERESINAAFLTMALQNGLSAAIMNPISEKAMAAYHTYLLLSGTDSDCGSYLSYMEKHSSGESKKPVAAAELTLTDAVVKGLRDNAAQSCKALLGSVAPMDIINEHIVPALDTVGKQYEEKAVYLPGLLMSAEAAQSAFEVIRCAMAATDNNKAAKGTVVLATVKGDIHDIGKNIVKVLLQNYGYQVVDLGKDVDIETVSQAVIQSGAGLLGLSALMTTTVKSMEQTIEGVRQTAPNCKIVVGGAVLTEEYARKIGADKYAKDAMQTVRYAEDIFGNI